MGKTDLRPTTFMVTSGNQSTASAMWVAKSQDLEVRTVHYIDPNDLHIKSSIILKNCGSATMSNVYCK